MTPRNPATKCRTCGNVNDNDRTYPSGRRVGLCRACDDERRRVDEERREMSKGKPYSHLLREVVCEKCGDVFIARTNNQKFCSRECRDLALSDWRKLNRESMAVPIPCSVCGKPFRRKSGSARTCSAECRREYRHRTDEHAALRARYRLSPEAFAAMRAECGNACEVCGSPFASRGDIHVDHDHSCCPGDTTCGKCVRGLLCRPCNIMLGAARDDPSILTSAIAFLGKPTLGQRADGPP